MKPHTKRPHTRKPHKSWPLNAEAVKLEELRSLFQAHYVGTEMDKDDKYFLADLSEEELRKCAKAISVRQPAVAGSGEK